MTVNGSRYSRKHWRSVMVQCGRHRSEARCVRLLYGDRKPCSDGVVGEVVLQALLASVCGLHHKTIILIRSKPEEGIDTINVAIAVVWYPKRWCAKRSNGYGRWWMSHAMVSRVNVLSERMPCCSDWNWHSRATSCNNTKTALICFKQWYLEV
jgi:hypothetical protein